MKIVWMLTVCHILGWEECQLGLERPKPIEIFDSGDGDSEETRAAQEKCLKRLAAMNRESNSVYIYQCQPTLVPTAWRRAKEGK